MKSLMSPTVTPANIHAVRPHAAFLGWGMVFTYLGLMVLLPIASLFWKASQRPLTDLWALVTHPIAVHAYGLTFFSAFMAALINSVFGFILAWILVRHRFPGRRLADGLVDLPFAVPGVVAGITLLTLYGPGGALGQFLDPETPLANFFQRFGITEVNLTASFWGVLLAQVFSSLPFVVRTVQPVLLEWNRRSRKSPIPWGRGHGKPSGGFSFPSYYPRF